MNFRPYLLPAGLLSAASLIAGCASGGPEANSAPAFRLAVATSQAKTNALVGRVVDQAGKSVANARVRYWTDPPALAQITRSGPYGYFETKPLDPGRWHARAEDVNLAPSHVVEFTVGDRQPLPMLLFPLQPGATLRVQLSDPARQVVRHASVQILGPEDFVTSLREAGAGVYESELGLPEGDLTLRVTAAGFAAVEKRFAVKPGEAKTLDLALETAAESKPPQPLASTPGPKPDSTPAPNPPPATPRPPKSP